MSDGLDRGGAPGRASFSRRRALGALLGGLAVGGPSLAGPSPVDAATPAPRIPFPIATPVPTTGVDAFETLLDDHRRIRELLDRLVDRRAERRATLMALEALMTVHNATEETFVYPAVGAVAGRKVDAQMLYHQQDDVKQVLWSLDRLLRLRPSREAEFTRAAKTLRVAVVEHMEQERTTDFPALRRALGAEGIDYLTRRVRVFRRRFA